MNRDYCETIATSMQLYITDVRDDDVLLGRGSGPNDHLGNKRFRMIVSERKEEYLATNHRLTKTAIAQEIVNRVLRNQGRFLRKLEDDELARYDVPVGVEAWALATSDTIMEKAKQALRQNLNKHQTGAIDDTVNTNGPPQRLSPKSTTSHSPVPSSRQYLPDSNHSLSDFEPISLSQVFPNSNDRSPVSVSTKHDSLSIQVISATPDMSTRFAHSNKKLEIQVPPPVTSPDVENPQSQYQKSRISYTGNESMEEIPVDECFDRPHESTMYMKNKDRTQGWRRRQYARQACEDDNMSIIVDSFSKLNTGDVSGVENDANRHARTQAEGSSFASRHKRFASTSTVETLEEFGTSSVADMSVDSFSSSMFSDYRGSERSVKRENETGGFAVIIESECLKEKDNDKSLPRMNVLPQPSSDQADVILDENSNQSRVLPDENSSHTISGGKMPILEEREYAMSGASVWQPRSLRLMEEGPHDITAGMTQSSLEMLKSALNFYSDWDASALGDS